VKLAVGDADLRVRAQTRRLAGRMMSPLCGLVQGVSFMARHRGGPRLVVAGGNLTGVHVLRGHVEPRRGAYHIGGCGVVLDEALIRTLGESCERYAQVASATQLAPQIRVASHAQLEEAGEPVPAPHKLRFFTSWQHERDRFPFQPFSADAPMGWLRAGSLLDDTSCWLPAQLLLLGYTPGQPAGLEGREPWLLPAVTTGTAAHTVPSRALRNALLELVQVDAAIGGWYAGAAAPEIVPDRRIEALIRLIQRQLGPHAEHPAFYWLPSPDLAGLVVACTLRSPTAPFVSVGLGADMVLVRALYKALIEAAGGMQLAQINLLEMTLAGQDAAGLDPARMGDLDSNVAFYAAGGNDQVLRARFGGGRQVRASELPPDLHLAPGEELRHLARAFSESGKELYGLDLTTPDLAQLGFRVARAWSPDLLQLPLPSFPPLAHPRFAAYGGVAHVEPHPYP
jgi:thiazole/oxazole-forming peptide maturase SagD family component